MIPFLILGIGVDNLFVIVTAVEQTDHSNDIESRMREAMGHAGASISITSLTVSTVLFLACG